MKKYLLLPVTGLIFLVGCRKKETPAPISAEKKITAFSYNYSNGNPELDVFIDEEGKRVVIHPNRYLNTDRDEYKINFRVSDKATAEPASGTVLNLATPKTIKVRAEDGSLQEYKVVRSMVELQINGYDPANINISQWLRLGAERKIFQSNADVKIALGKYIQSTSGGYFNSFFQVKLKNYSIASGLAGTYSDLNRIEPFVDWEFINSFFFTTIPDAGTVTISSYDASTKTCSGRIDGLKSILKRENGIVAKYVEVNALFENIPVL
jgi:hypothetical protein